MNPDDFNTFLDSYFETAAWADLPEGSEEWSDFSPESISLATKDCKEFLANIHPEWINENYIQAGHDFWLSRKHHGDGFWDRENIYGKENAIKLQNVAERFGESIYVEVVNGMVEFF